MCVHHLRNHAPENVLQEANHLPYIRHIIRNDTASYKLADLYPREGVAHAFHVGVVPRAAAPWTAGLWRRVGIFPLLRRYTAI